MGVADMVRRPILILAAGLLLAACGSGATTAGTVAPASPSPAPTTASAPSPSPAAVASGSGPTIVVKEVNATNMGGAFEPASLTVHVGDTVQWVNSSGNIHNVTFATGGITSPIMYAGEKFSYTFSKAGTYRYTCTFHPGMDGTILVS